MSCKSQIKRIKRTKKSAEKFGTEVVLILLSHI